MTECNFGVGELITLAEEHEGLAPMKQWEFFEVEEIMPSGVVRLFCHTDDAIRFVSVELLNKHFDTADKSPNIRYEDGTNTTDFPAYVKVNGTEAKKSKKADKKAKKSPFHYYKGKIKTVFEVGKEVSKAETGSGSGKNLIPYRAYGFVDGEEVFPLSVTEKYIDSLLEGAEISVQTFAGKCTVVNVCLANGFTLSASSSCVSDMNYSEEVGYTICMNKIKNQLWEMEAYFLHKILEDEDGKMEFDVCIDKIDCDTMECNQCPFNGSCINCDYNCQSCELHGECPLEILYGEGF